MEVLQNIPDGNEKYVVPYVQVISKDSENVFSKKAILIELLHKDIYVPPQILGM